MAEHNELGKMGEKAAAEMLRQKGHVILERNWRFYGYELDIVSETNEYLVFVEVKTRQTDMWGRPEEFVGKSRMKRMVEAANEYMIENDVTKPVRFDIVGVVINKHGTKIEHFEDAFLPFM